MNSRPLASDCHAILSNVQSKITLIGHYIHTYVKKPKYLTLVPVCNTAEIQFFYSPQRVLRKSLVMFHITDMDSDRHSMPAHSIPPFPAMPRDQGEPESELSAFSSSACSASPQSQTVVDRIARKHRGDIMNEYLIYHDVFTRPVIIVIRICTEEESLPLHLKLLQKLFTFGHQE